MARLRHQQPPEPAAGPPPRRATRRAKSDASGITWPPSITGWHDADGVWHQGDPRRLLEQDWTVPPVLSLDTADAEADAERFARQQERAERQAATESARRPVRHDDIPGRPIRPRWSGTSEERER